MLTACIASVGAAYLPSQRPAPGAPLCGSARGRAAVRCAEAGTLTQSAVDDWLGSAVAARGSVASGLLDEVRSEATDIVLAARRPGRKQEAWRRTDLSLLYGATLGAPSGRVGELVAGYVEEEEAAAAARPRLVFVDGVYSADLSDTSSLGGGAYAGPLGELVPPEVREAVLESLREIPEREADPRTELGCHTFAALNQAALSDVACVYVPSGVAAGTLRLILLSTASLPDSGAEAGASPQLAASHPNLSLWLGDGASLSLLQQYAGRGAYFCNGLSRLLLGENASLTHAYLQEQSDGAVHVDSVLATLAAGARYDANLVQSGGRLSRVNLGVRLEGRHSRASLSGIALGSESQLLDLHSAVRHVSPDCSLMIAAAQPTQRTSAPLSRRPSTPAGTSEQEQRNALAGRARVVFRGAVQVPHGSDNTTANQLCRSLLLSDSARVDISPNLEILTDDVVCTHGATVADLDDEMVFYLQARGLGRAEARVLLLEGWARSLMGEVPSEAATRRVAAKAAGLAREGAAREVRKQAMSSI
mmetsp:Transcript_49373/g.164816  ORF Transcript_49373/g.164816 Transcript_49373/m.164816 type:complete len:534 (+) Transcript_49373:43-1644(+)